ncbi:hypothetical protein EKE94_04135 [Mesobaculum littorinae]|uniref:Long-chain fatty acid transport protein n=1 Tax=Mesobaculum littorinae TaxID=2486419 RepID=A0A438AMI1_9RHOB|nr:outer membrane protein transport protein [Mesobaculum littorinae]RVV99864.1 hypothetical protein EKE94_04135 [Mesobaculum littorinae]
MQYLFTGLAGLAIVSAGAAGAAGIERARTPIDVLFEEGNHVQFSFSYVDPSVDGTYAAPLGGGDTGDALESYLNAGVALKYQFSDRLSGMVALGQPYGADASYSEGIYTGLAAEWDSTSLTGILKYEFNDNISVYGGPRIVKSQAEIDIPPALIGAATGVPVAYNAGGDPDTDVGYVLGAAYSRPDIALRVGLTYESAITHEFDSVETVGGVATDTTTEVELPQSLTLDFQTGVAPKTLLFGSVRWSEWSEWQVAPPVYLGAAGQPVTGFDHDVFAYSLGLGRQLTDDLSVFARVGYETSEDTEMTRLSPIDGRTSFGIGGSYQVSEATEITAGIEYIRLGDAFDSTGTTYEDNSALGIGVQIGMKF